MLPLLWPDMSLPVGTLAATVVAAVAATTSKEDACMVTVDPPMTVVSVVCTSMVVDIGAVDASELGEFVVEVADSLLVDVDEGTTDGVCVDTEELSLEQIVPYSVLVIACVRVTVVVTGIWKMLASPMPRSPCQLFVRR